MKQFLFSLWLIFALVFSGLAQSVNDVDQVNNEAESLLNQDPKQSLDAASKGKFAGEKINYQKGISAAIAIMGVANYKVDEYDTAKSLLSKAAALSEQIKDTSGIAFCKYWLGNLELNKGKYANALDLYQAAYSLSEKANDKKNIARSLDGKASIYESLDEDDKALEFYRQALDVAHQAGFKEWYAGGVSALAELAYKKGNIDEAINKYNESIRLSDEENNLNNKANCYQQLASIYYQKHDSKQAMEYTQKAMDIFQQTGSVSSYSYSRLLMSSILLNDKEYDVAISLAKASLDEGKEKDEVQLQKNAAEVLYYAYRGKGDNKQALDYHVLFHQLFESNHSDELSRKLSQMELQTKLEKEEKDAKLREGAMKAQIERQKLIDKVLFIGVVLLFIIAGFVVFMFVQKRQRKN